MITALAVSRLARKNQGARYLLINLSLDKSFSLLSILTLKVKKLSGIRIEYNG